MKRRFTVSVDEALADATDELVQSSDVNRSELVGIALRRLVREWEDDLPEWVQKEVTHADLVKKNRPFIREMHFKQNVRDYLVQNCLLNERNNPAKFPPHPDKVRDRYADSLKDEIDQTDMEYADEYKEHLESQMRWYEAVHPDTGGSTTTEGIISMVEYYMREEGEGEAREFLRMCSERGKIPSGQNQHQILDEARDRIRNKQWKFEWEDSVKANW